MPDQENPEPKLNSSVDRLLQTKPCAAYTVESSEMQPSRLLLHFIFIFKKMQCMHFANRWRTLAAQEIYLLLTNGGIL